jgi:hypothetical protein
MSLTALALAVALQTPGGVTSTPVADLIGLSPSEASARLGAAPDPAGGEALRIVDGDRLVEIHPIQRFWREPAVHGDLGVRPGSVICLSGVVPSSGEPVATEAVRGLLAGSRGQFVFVDGRLHSVHVTPPRSDSRPTPRNAREGRAFSRSRAQGSPWPVSPGRLPISDQASAVARLGPAVGADAVVRSDCRPVSEPSPTSPNRGDWALALAGAMTLWPLYVVTQPFAQAEHERAEREGGALLANFLPGAELPQTPEDLARGQQGVRVFRDRTDPAFAIVAIRLGLRGSSPGVALAGVRDRRVIWVAGPAATGRLALSDALCLNDEGMLDDGRPGCTDYGYRP